MAKTLRGVTVTDREKRDLPEFVRSGVVNRPDQTFLHLVMRGLAKYEHSDRKGRLYASDSAYCPRQAVAHSQASGDVVRPAAFRFYVELGNTVEDLILTGLHEVGSMLFKNYRLPPIGIDLGGKIDAIVYVNNKIRVLEIKSCGALPTKPRPYQAAQAQMYAAVTGLRATLLYFSRSVADYSGTLQMQEFDLPWEESSYSLWQAVYSHFANQLGVLPDVPAHITSASHCGFCELTGSCFGSDPLPAIPRVTADQHEALVAQTNAFVDEFMDPARVANRRTGILNHLQRVGSQGTRDFLASTDWSTLI